MNCHSHKTDGASYYKITKKEYMREERKKNSSLISRCYFQFKLEVKYGNYRSNEKRLQSQMTWHKKQKFQIHYNVTIETHKK